MEIATIQIGDEVYAYNEETGEVGLYPVTDIIAHVDEVIIHLTIDGELIETTPEHPFYTDDGVWIEAEDLQPGDLIHSQDGDTGTVEAVLVIPDADQRMYNLTVAKAHTFFVGAGDWLVHNTDCPIELQGRTLFLGEGDFSFSLGNIRRLDDDQLAQLSITSTIYESFDALEAPQMARLAGNRAQLERFGKTPATEQRIGLRKIGKTPATEQRIGLSKD